MTYLNRLWRAELSAISALLVCAIFMSIGAYIENLIVTAEGKHSIFSASTSAWLLFSYTAVIGVFPVILFGAPIYAVINKNVARLIHKTILISLVPGIIFLFYEIELGLWAIGCGVIVSTLTHYIYSYFFMHKKSSNKSFKPTPKSGAV